MFTVKIARLSQSLLLAALTVTSMLAAVGDVQAQEFADLEGKNISSLVIRYKGAKTVDEARLRGNMATRAGQKYSAAVLDEDVRSLYESGLVDDIRFLAEPSGSSVRVIAEVQSRAKIVGIGFQGNERYNDRKLTGVAKLDLGGVLSDTSILSARRNVLDHYRGSGYADVTVSHRIVPTGSEGNSQLILVVDEGARSEVRTIRFEGNKSCASHVLRNQMKTKQKGWFSFFTKSGQIDNDKLEEDVDRVLDYYRDNGYLRAKAVIGKAPLDDGRVDLVIKVTEGAEYKVAKVGFGPTKVFTSAQLTPVLTMVAGNAYSVSKMRNDIRTIRSYYGSRGYADAAVSPDIRNVSKNTISITYRINEGTPSKVGRITIEGNEKTQDRVIRRELSMEPGQNLNSVELETTNRRLRNINYFDDVQVDSSASNLKGYRDINIHVKEKQTGSIGFGAGFSSVDNIVGFINLEQTNFDITNWGRFTGGGQRFSAKIQAGAERREFTLSLTEPWFLGRRLALGTELFYRDSLFFSSEYEQSQFGGAVSLRKPISKRSFLRAEYRAEQIEIDVESDTPAGSLFFEEEGEFVRSAASVSFVYDSRDSNQQPRKGEKLSAELTLAGGILGGDVDVYIVSFEGSKYWNLWGDSILSLRGNLTVADTYGDSDRVPIFDRESLGGPQSLRGFENRDVGPRDPLTDEVLGGNTSAFASIEYTFPLVDRVRGAVFYDAGVVDAGSWEFGNGLYHDAGFGLRLNLPFGPLAIDYGIPLGTPDGVEENADQGGQFHFYLNYAF